MTLKERVDAITKVKKKIEKRRLENIEYLNRMIEEAKTRGFLFKGIKQTDFKITEKTLEAMISKAIKGSKTTSVMRSLDEMMLRKIAKRIVKTEIWELVVIPTADKTYMVSDMETFSRQTNTSFVIKNSRIKEIRGYKLLEKEIYKEHWNDLNKEMILTTPGIFASKKQGEKAFKMIKELVVCIKKEELRALKNLGELK